MLKSELASITFKSFIEVQNVFQNWLLILMTSTVPLAVSKWSSAFIKFLKQKADQEISEEYSGIALKDSLMY